MHALLDEIISLLVARCAEKFASEANIHRVQSQATRLAIILPPAIICNLLLFQKL